MSATVFWNATNELATVGNTFSVSGTPTDPTAVTLVVTTPSGTATTYTYSLGEITRTGTGVYTKDVSTVDTVRGVWTAVWAGTSAASDVEVVTWTTHDTALNKLYCTPAELKSRVGITDSLDDDQIIAACEAVSRWIDGWCDTRFYRATATRTFEPTSLYCLPVPDLVSITTLKTDVAGDGTFETTWSASDYQLLPLNPGDAPETRPYNEIKAVGTQTFPVPYWSPNSRSDRVEIVGVWGWPAVPDAVKHAAAVMSSDYLKLGGMSWGVQSYGDYGAVRARPNPVALGLLAPYRRNPILVG